MQRIPLTEEEVSICRFLLAELQSMKLTVVKIPGDPDKLSTGVRAVVCPNPDWYSRFCSQHLAERPNGRWKRARTKIRRPNTIHALNAMISLRSRSDGIYGQGLAEAIEWVRWRFEENAGLAAPDLCSGADTDSF